MKPRLRLRPAARIARAKAAALAAERRHLHAAAQAAAGNADDAILTAMANTKLPIGSQALAALTGLTRSMTERRLRALRAAARVRWVPGTTWTPGWAFPRADAPRT